MRTRDQSLVGLFINDLSLEKLPRQKTRFSTVPGTRRILSVHHSSHYCNYSCPLDLRLGKRVNPSWRRLHCFMTTYWIIQGCVFVLGELPSQVQQGHSLRSERNRSKYLFHHPSLPPNILPRHLLKFHHSPSFGYYSKSCS